MSLENIIKPVKKLIGASLLAGALVVLPACTKEKVVYEEKIVYVYQNNKNPIVNAIPDQAVQEGELFTLDLKQYISDEDEDALTIEQTDGPGNIDSDMQYNYQDSRDDDKDNDEHTVSFKVKDGRGGEGVGSFKLTQQDNYSPNHPPVIQAIPDQTVQEGQSADINLEDYASDEDGDPLIITKVSGPGNIVGNRFQYQDSKDNDKADNLQDIIIKASDGKGGEATRGFKLIQQDNYYRLPVNFLNALLNWICFAPTNFNPNMLQFPSDSSVRADLTTLLNANFKGVITYGSDNILGSIPRIAKELGFSKVIMGIWDFNNQEEWSNAIAAKDYVDGYCIGNEGLRNGRYTLSELINKMEELRRATDKPVTTAEPVDDYDNDLFDAGDWVFPITHPYWHNQVTPANAANWTLQQYQNLISRTSKRVVLKEVGLPSAGASGLSEANQNQYYRTLEDLTKNISGQVFAYFEAFNQPWKTWAAVEPYWGLFKQDTTTKAVSKPQILFTSVPSKGSYCDLEGRTVNILPANYMVSVHIKVNGVWWMKPYWSNPLTGIVSNGGWATDITTGGQDQLATEIYAAIVASDYNPLLLIVQGKQYNILPLSTDPKVKASTRVTR